MFSVNWKLVLGVTRMNLGHCDVEWQITLIYKPIVVRLSNMIGLVTKQAALLWRESSSPLEQPMSFLLWRRQDGYNCRRALTVKKKSWPFLWQHINCLKEIMPQLCNSRTSSHLRQWECPFWVKMLVFPCNVTLRIYFLIYT